MRNVFGKKDVSFPWKIYRISASVKSATKFRVLCLCLEGITNRLESLSSNNKNTQWVDREMIKWKPKMGFGAGVRVVTTTLESPDLTSLSRGSYRGDKCTRPTRPSEHSNTRRAQACLRLCYLLNVALSQRSTTPKAAIIGQHTEGMYSMIFRSLSSHRTKKTNLKIRFGLLQTVC